MNSIWRDDDAGTLRQQIERQEHQIRAAIPADREGAMLALLRVLAGLVPARADSPEPDLITGRRIAGLGANKALQFCLESPGRDDLARSGGDGLMRWAERFLRECEQIVRAEAVLAHGETGFMRMVDDGAGIFSAWVATKRLPTIWQERADIDWWASSLAARSDHERGESAQNDADLHLKMMAYQLNYPSDAVIAGCPVRTYCDVLAWLIRQVARLGDPGQRVMPQSRRAVVAAIAAELHRDPEVIESAVDAFTVERENAAYHAAVPGVAAAPLVRLDEDRFLLSPFGLLTQPFFFLTRELRRRDAEAYHNSGYLREEVFRQDLYRLFADKRFVTSPGRIKLRRTDGDVRTDIDAAVFDRKTGTFALFELKSQDPFARSTAELVRQRDNVLYANRQISGILGWLQRYGAGEILNRIDRRAAKTFKTHKVYPFVLGRYLVHFTDGPAPDRRAAWGTWPQLLRLLDSDPIDAKQGNPLASLFTRLSNDTPLIDPFARGATPVCVILLGDARLVVYPSYAAFQRGLANT